MYVKNLENYQIISKYSLSFQFLSKYENLPGNANTKQYLWFYFQEAK